MAESRRGLGRGLSALLEEAAEATTPEKRGAAGVSELAVGVLWPDPEQPRRRFDEDELDDLATSIRQHGIIQPILARPHPRVEGEYQIIAGERRWRAAQKAGCRTIPALIRELSDAEVMEVALIENLQRADLTALEEAHAYQSMMRRRDGGAEEIGRIVGKSRSHVANTVRLLLLPLGVQDLLEQGRLTSGHARALIGHPDAERLAAQIVNRGLSVRQTETLVRTRELKRPAAARRGAKDADTQAVESDLAEVLGMAVEIADSGGAGRLTIQYKNLEQLDEICRRLLSRPGRAA